MTDRYKELREALAAGPTAGPWWCDPLDWYVDRVVDTDSGESIGVCDAHNIVTGKYIAAADPDTIRELLDERDALQAQIDAEKSRECVFRSNRPDSPRKGLFVASCGTVFYPGEDDLPDLGALTGDYCYKCGGLLRCAPDAYNPECSDD